MPCRDGRDEIRTYEDTSKIEALQKRLDQCTLVLCSFSRQVQRQDNKLYNHILSSDLALSTYINEHIVHDKERYYKHYKTKYPQFDANEIYKMVINGILEDV